MTGIRANIVVVIKINLGPLEQNIIETLRLNIVTSHKDIG
jgi:hypothetical protein